MGTLREWWDRLSASRPGPPSDEFQNIEQAVESQARRIDVLELKIRILETRLKAEDAITPTYRQSA